MVIMVIWLLWLFDFENMNPDNPDTSCPAATLALWVLSEQKSKRV